MTTSTFSAAPSNASDAEFRAWGSALSTALAAVGLVKSSDTGQIDWTTVVKPASSSTYQGYEVWRFSDTLQATKPLYLKLEYGSGASSASRPSIRIQVGKGSDGAGALTGTFGAAGAIPAANFSATPASGYVSSGDGSLIAVALWPGSVFAINFFIERSRDTAGTPTGWAAFFNTSSTFLSSYVYSTATAFQAGSAPSPLPTNAASTTVGGVAPMFPILCMDGQGHYWQSRAILQYNANDAALGVPVTVAGWGTYLPTWVGLGNTGTNAAIAWS